MFTTGETVGLAEWIIDDTCLVIPYVWYCSIMQVHSMYHDKMLNDVIFTHDPT